MKMKIVRNGNMAWKNLMGENISKAEDCITVRPAHFWNIHVVNI
jgi:hypothetical protein